ncbi:hypothetical protein M233_08260 [Xylella fastidiosa subsp. multiplex Griffin-1]|nr:hypothetical protein M233_08260 [Xylella fastidiosa subsp. multiplex Griffin-1]
MDHGHIFSPDLSNAFTIEMIKGSLDKHFISLTTWIITH